MNKAGIGAGLQGFMQGAFDAMKLYMSYEQMKHNQTQDERLFELNKNLTDAQLQEIQSNLTPKEKDSEFTTTISKEYVDKEGKNYYDVLVTNKKTGEVTRKTLEAGMLDDYVKNINGIGKRGASEEDLYRDLFDKAFKYSAKEVGLDNQNFDFSTLKDEKLQNKILFYMDATTPEKFKPYVINKYIQTLIDNGITKPVVKRGTDGNDYTVVNVGGRDYIVTKEK